MAGEIHAYGQPRIQFTMIRNEFVRNAEIKPSAFRIAALVFSHTPGEFRLTQGSIARALDMNETTVRSSFKQLEQLGYLVRVQTRDEGGHRAADDLHLSQVPFSEEQRAELLRDGQPGNFQGWDSQHGESLGWESHAPKETNSSKKTNPEEESKDLANADASAVPALFDPPGDQEEGRKEPTPSEVMDAEFETWWGAWPKKTAKEAARKAYRAARKTTSADVLQAAVAPLGARYAQLPKDRRQYVVYPATYLNQHRWEDPPEEVVRLDGNRVQTGGAEAYQPGLESRRNEENWQRLYAENPERFSVADMGLDDDGPAF